ncbi:ATP-binding protein [Parendozoicomonas haliclonae]|uniref:histidine kinase n=1 Tax=Parendozoicomonas haliclonae TaxID=1960125 RepID=A0A1X7AEF0_9GAMM|nr:ATP-binding protein [Parendozoicomonas haliclonae]SMA33746.1 Sensor histidine kinase RegB [Parendozoicomonas haliclonae]
MPLRFTTIGDVGLRNLQSLNSVRWIVLLLQLVSLAVASSLLDFTLPWKGIAVVSVLILALTVYTAIRCRSSSGVTAKELERHLATDVLFQSALLYLTGGYTNPFIFVYLITVIIGAALLPRRRAWTITALAICGYTLLQVWYLPLAMIGAAPAGDVSGMDHSAHDVTMELSVMALLHLGGMWLIFSVSACLVTGVVAPMAASLRQQRAAVAASREQQLRNERIVSVALTAAGAAHELGTPLSTMSVVLQDMSLFGAEDPELKEDISLLQSQVELCRERLRRIVNSSRDQTIKVQPSSAFIHQVLEEWQLLRPSVALNANNPADLKTFLETDPSLGMALINLLNNAADAGGEAPVSLSFNETIAHLVISIHDRGDGVAGQVAQRPGATTQSDKQNGLGIGLQLSVATVEKFSGVVNLKTASEGGTVTEITLPVVAGDK